MEPESEARETRGQEPHQRRAGRRRKDRPRQIGQNGAADLTGAQTDGQAQTGGQAQTDGQAQTGGQAQTDGQAQTGGQAQTDGQASGAKPETAEEALRPRAAAQDRRRAGRTEAEAIQRAIKDYPVTT